MRIWPTKRGWKRFGIALLILVAAALVWNGVMAWRVEMQLKSRRANIRAAGDPASISDLAPKRVPERENAAAIIAGIRDRLKQYSDEHQRFLATPIGKAYDAAREHEEILTTEQTEAVLAILDKYADVETTLTAASVCDRYASVGDYTLNHHDFLDQILKERIEPFRMGARYLERRMIVLTASGQRQQAVEKGLVLLRLARQYDQEPMIISMMVACAVRSLMVPSLYDAIATGPLSPELRQELDRELVAFDNPRRMMWALKSERAFAIDAQLTPPTNLHLSPAPLWLFHMFAWRGQQYHIGAIDFLADEIQSLSQAHSEVENRGREWRLVVKPSQHGVLADLMIPAVQATYTAGARASALLRSLLVFNALCAYAEKNGREAKGLEELGLPREATIDPFSGEPLKLQHTDDGWVVYSVMTNGVDDGGDFKDMKDYGVAPRKWRQRQ